MPKKHQNSVSSPTIENRKARYNFFIEDNKINLANPKIETLTKNLINFRAEADVIALANGAIEEAKEEID